MKTYSLCSKCEERMVEPGGEFCSFCVNGERLRAGSPSMKFRVIAEFEITLPLLERVGDDGEPEVWVDVGVDEIRNSPGRVRSVIDEYGREFQIFDEDAPFTQVIKPDPLEKVRGDKLQKSRPTVIIGETNLSERARRFKSVPENWNDPFGGW